MIGVPAEPVVASVGIDRAEDAARCGQRQFVLEVVAGEGCVVDLDVDLHLVLEAVALQEGEARLRVVVVLMLRGLLRLGLEQDRAAEADVVLVLDDLVQEPAELIELSREVGVEEGLVAFAAAPEDIVLASEAVGDIHAVLHLGGRTGVDLGVRVGGGTGHVPRVAEQAGRAPQQTDTGALHMGGHVVGEFVQVGGLLGKRRAGGSDIVVVEAEVRDAELLEELEGGCHLGAGRFHRLEVGGEPRAVERAVAEDIVARPVERVPVAHRHAQVLGHRLLADHTISVVPTERKRVVGFRALEADGLGHRGEKVGHGSPWVHAR